MQADFSPLCVFIIEPALSYCVSFLRQKFPTAKLYAIRFFDDFSDTDTLWDFVFYLKKYGKHTEHVPLSERLFNFLGEESLISSCFFDWHATQMLFPSESAETWQEIKKAILKARDVIGTRSYFSKRWFKNALIFTAHIQHPVVLEKTRLPILIAASGPSLHASIPYIKKFRSSFFLIALSSAFMPLAAHEITPNLVMSSDGGFWAKKHLDFHPQPSDTIFALETESAVPKSILESKKILPLIYEDSLGKDFLDSLSIPFLISKRNGTVAGTALEFAFDFTHEKIYVCGLDQAPAPAFQHTQPNALEIDNAQTDFKLRTKESRITFSRFRSETSLEIYRNWFISNSDYFAKRVFRLSDTGTYQYPLGKIKDIRWTDFERLNAEFILRDSSQQSKKTESNGHTPVQAHLRKETLQTKLKSIAQTKRFSEEVFPMEAILIRRELSQAKKQELQAQLEEKIEKFIHECERLF